ncbi:MAG: RagB/SusD family nutrient uptake outer membrane protein [Empedobacter falsenii]|uniref:RagB/SusD family nutrient uptake outer membrane protein n=1 Tax=unclassified Empedobacter TaxID=2643773 RepID=UPI0025C69928|nr:MULTISPECIES: RagB/SusD family nutrient uptake outer membrane protein [unclassified Empedobacter]
MKKIIITLFIAGCVLQSCSSDLLDTSPDSSKVTPEFYKDAAQIKQGLNAVYASLQYKGQYELAMLTIGEITSDNTYDEVPANDGFTYGELDFFTIQPNNSLIANTWKDNYVGIQQANIVLNRIDKVVDMDEKSKNETKAELRFLRAMMYFNLVRIFGDVPLVTKETTNVNEFFGQGRTSLQEVYQFIETELKNSLTNLPIVASQKGKVTKGAALGILAKVLITQNKYNEALPYLKEIEALGYELQTDPNKIFDVANKNNSEIIFDVQFTSGLNGNTEGSTAYQMFMPSGFVSGAKGHNLPTKEIYELFSMNDKRRDAFIGKTNNNVLYTKKLQKTSNDVADGGSNVVVLRLADIYLLLAECYANSNDFSNANIYLNKIKTRASIPSVNLTIKNDLLNEIELERRKELVGEGHRWFDLVRTGKAIETMTKHLANTPGYGTAIIKANNLLMPIPQSQVNTDPAIKQNPGY